MAIVVLVLWAFTAGAGFYLLFTSSLGRAGPAGPPVPAPQPAVTAGRAARDRWAPPSLVAARQAPILPSARSLVEFAHPAGGITGLAFWLGFTLVHNRALGWIAFGVVAATACVGLGWFTANTRAARRAGPGRDSGPGGPAGRTPSFAGRLVALHGSAAAVTIALAALTALVHG
jgi:hypothetical protein